MFTYNDRDQREEDFINNYEGEPEESVDSAYKRFLEDGLSEFLNSFDKELFENGQFAITISINKLQFPGWNFDDVEEKKFLVMEVIWYPYPQKQENQEKYEFFDNYDNDNYNEYDSYDYDAYDDNDEEYFQKKERESKDLKKYDETGDIIYCCELYDYIDYEMNIEFEYSLIDKIKCFLSNFIYEIGKDKNISNSISLCEKINYEDFIKAREEELGRINGKNLKKSR